jgi:hypothetical protein
MLRLVALSLLTLTAVSHADNRERLASRLEAGTPRERGAAARELAPLVATDAWVESLAQRAVLSDDRAVRTPLLTAIVDAGHLTRAAAARVPARSALRRRLPRYRVDQCSLVLSPDATDPTVTCRRVIKEECLRSTIETATVHVGARWSIETTRSQEPNDLCDF